VANDGLPLGEPEARLDPGSDDDSVVPHGTIEIDIPSRVDLVAVVRMVVAAATNAVGALEGDRLDDLRWVTSEATTNAIQANQSINGDGRVVITCDVADGVVRLSVRDEGPGMPEHYEVPDITHPDRLLIEGAFGVPLMERLASACQFVTAATGTTVNMELHQ
jgi:anti-sigma regulatory factor (Ser/Thr protein kinase)